MATNSDNVLVGVTGAIYKAPAGTTLPTSAYAALDVAFKELGFVTEEGVTEAQLTQVTNLRAWQNGTVVRKVQTEHDVTYQFTLMEHQPGGARGVLRQLRHRVRWRQGRDQRSQDARGAGSST